MLTNANYWPHKTAAAVLAAIVASSCLVVVVDAELPYTIALKGATYTIKSELVRSQETIQLEEFHSNQQRRSRVNYQIRGSSAVPSGFSDWFGSFLADDHEAFEVYYKCKAVEHKAIGKALYMDMLYTNDISSFHLIGVARLLMDIEIRSEHFEPAPSEGLHSAKTYVAGFGSYKVTVYYEDDRILALGVPSAINFYDTISSESITVRPKLVTPLKSDETILTDLGLPGIRQLSYGAHDLLIDVFAIKRGRGCAQHMRNPTSVATGKYRFSFKANLLTKNSPPVHLIAGYEPELETLRVDHSYGAKWSQTLTNFRHDRRYNVVRRVAGLGDGEERRPLDDYFDARHANDVSCVVSRAGSNELSKGLSANMHTLGRLLYGASQIFYLGRARVRGMDAFMYEAYDSKLPIWLDAPSFYETQEGEQNLRDGRLPNEKSPRLLTTVLYFKRPLSDAESELLLIEIFSGNDFILHTIPIYEFSWDIRPIAPNGERWEDFFSLGDVCLAPSSGNNHYARFNLQLKDAQTSESSRANGDLDWIQVPAKRNIALIKSINDQFKVPSTLIYDLESRARGITKDMNEVALTLMIAERNDAPVTLEYVGKAKEPRGIIVVEQVISFQNCFELAAHKQVDTLFAYLSPQSRCYIYPSKRIPSDPKSDGYPFPIYPTGQFEVYQTVHGVARKRTGEAYLAQLDETRDRIIDNGRISLNEPSVKMVQSVYFHVMNIEVEHLNDKVSYDLDDHHLADVNKFPGLGLVADDPQNKLVEPKEMSEGAITFEQCQEACLVDLECESYSTCIVDGKVQCVLSTVDFKVPTTVIELMLVRDKKSKLGEVSEIKLAGGQPEVSTQAVDLSIVHIKKHPTCELHNKLYRDVFKRAGLVKIDLKGRLLRPVSHPEQCAEFCFLGTLATMRKELRRLHKTIHDKDDPGLTEGYSASHCGHYFYLDQKKLARSKVKIPAEQIIGTNTDGATRGYCVFDDGSTGDVTASGEKELGSSRLTFELRKFELDFTVLYEKKHGVSLVGSMKTSEEEVAYTKLLSKQDYTSEHLETMREFIQSGGNIAKLGPAESAQGCARTCFTQSIILWPACQSFDIIELELRKTATRITICVYSTSTLRELRELGRTDLIRENNTQKYFVPQASDEIQVWRYEPRQGLVASSVEQHYQISIDQSETRLDQIRRMAGASLHMSTFGLLLTICIVIAAGLGVGMRMSPTLKIDQILSRAGLANVQSRGDAEILVDDAEGL